MTSPKHSLVGVRLESGWVLEELLSATSDSSGGTFGVGYRASRGTELAFVKAVDFVAAMTALDPLDELRKLTDVALFERDILSYCTERRMSRVLKFLGAEYVTVGDGRNPLERAYCLVVEAGHTDLRRLVSINGEGACHWNLSVLKDVVQAIAQLHGGGIAHNDIKPSNVIAFEDGSAGHGHTMKIGDLGRVVRKGATGPFDNLAWPGDTRYSPPETWYGFQLPDWCDSRESADAYMLGSLLFFLFTGVTVQLLVLTRLEDPFKPGNWKGRYDDDLLPVLQNAHFRAIEDDLLPRLVPEIADDVVAIAKALTHPDPRKRGDLKARAQHGRPVGLDRIYQRLSMIVYRCAAIERGRPAR